MNSAPPRSSARRRLAAGALLVGFGWLASPNAVPIYDGLQQPDEPYRYVAPPSGYQKTAPPTSSTTTTPVKNGSNTDGLSLQTGEMTAQFSVFLPQFSMAAKGTSITITVKPEAPAAGPPATKPDGNTYAIAFNDPAGPVTLTDKAAIATLYMRATSQSLPQPTMYFRAQPTDPWKALATTAGGYDVRVASFIGAGEYALALPEGAKAANNGIKLLPLILLGALVLLVIIVVVVRLRAQPDTTTE